MGLLTIKLVGYPNDRVQIEAYLDWTTWFILTMLDLWAMYRKTLVQSVADLTV